MVETNRNISFTTKSIDIIHSGCARLFNWYVACGYEYQYKFIYF